MDDTAFNDHDFKPWAPFPEIIDYLKVAARGSHKILDVGAGQTCFPLATHTADLVPISIPNVISVTTNFRTRELPFDDDFFDFVYCRHTFEDLDDPSRLISEIQRVGKRGYIETPSPLSEVCRGIDAGSPVWRGYSHHRQLLWVEDGALCILPKFPLIEYIILPDAENIKLLRKEPLLANTYFMWDDKFTIRFMQDELLGGGGRNYWTNVSHSIAAGIVGSRQALAQFATSRNKE